GTAQEIPDARPPHRPRPHRSRTVQAGGRCMSELGYVELPILQWLSGHGSATPGDAGLGWTYRDEAAMAAFERPLPDPLVEELLVGAILRINPHVTTPDQARRAIKALRTTMDAPDRLSANRETLNRWRDGVQVALVPGE